MTVSEGTTSGIVVANEFSPAPRACSADQQNSKRQLYGTKPKRALDIAGAAAIGMVFLPMMIIIALLVRLSGKSVFFRQIRIGKGGKEFYCYKFRTMHENSEQMLLALFDCDEVARAEWTQTRKLRNDPRVTLTGRFLRKTSLDELPQVFNVLRGDMSLVGPRPIVSEELPLYRSASSKYLSLTPGLTGLWQVMGRNDVTYARRVAMDSYYAQNQSLVLDFWILLRTVRMVLAGSGAY